MVVAIKRVARIFDDAVEARRILREVRLMRSLRHDALLSLVDVDVPALDAWANWHDVYLVSVQMDRDLHRVLRSPVPLTDAHCRFFAWQLLAGVKYMHSAKVLHRDLKPANLLVNEDCSLRICDFGLARYDWGRLGRRGGRGVTPHTICVYTLVPRPRAGVMS
eukprot:TRINITY_DN2774_c0_g1_i4.p3 TRINITY_DN2774_c0_g1~~TRINITY_DN2774_c0_g1_i4.p3  ORF type:complete len:163 (+),score=43.49 TRINITY_DN2774_c0_g1_i4:570-1058(+)